MALKYQCRHHENELPEVGNFVMVLIKQHSETGIHGKLLEYNHIDGKIPLSEIPLPYHHDMRSYIRVKRNEVLVVTRVDKEKGYVGLSKQPVSPEDVVACQESFKKLKQVNGILRRVAGTLKIPVLGLWESIAWPLVKEYGSAYKAFQLSTTEPEVWNKVQFASQAIRELLLGFVAAEFTVHPVKLCAHVEVQCSGYEGIDAVKAALHAGEAAATEAVPLKVNLVAPPLYVIYSPRCFNADEGIMVLEKAIIEIKKSIEAVDGGRMAVAMGPKITTDGDDKILGDLMAKKTRENLEVSGDGDEYAGWARVIVRHSAE